MSARHLTSICLLLCTTAISLATVAQDTPAIALDMHQAASGNFYVHATMAGAVETDLLLDTGSGYVSLSKATFDRISATSSPRFSRHIFGTMANGKVQKVPMYYLDELALSPECVLRNIEVAVFPRADRDILGLNALARLQPFTLELAPARLTSSHCAAQG